MNYDYNADGFSTALSTSKFIDEFKKVLELTIFSYEEIKKNKKKLDSFKENNIRDIFIKYFRKYKEQFDIFHLHFDAETQEISNDSKTKGFIDIKISNVNKLMGNENEYYSLECKRLDGYSNRNKKYFNEGVFRFIKNKYSENMPLSGMIGFVQGFQKKQTISDLITSIGSIIANDINTMKSLVKCEIEDSFHYSYKSKHKRRSNYSIDIYHLFFDFTNKH